MNMNARIELLKNLLTKKRWKTVEATLYSTERDLLSYLTGKTQTCVMPYDALSECQDTLEKIGLILPNGAITSVGMMYLEGVGQIEPSQSIEPAHTIEQELSNSPTALSDCLTEAASVVKGERQESYGPAERNLSRIAELWSSYLDHPITSRNVAVMMILLKAARDAHKTKHDNMVDICGYAYLADILDKESALK